MLRNYLLTSIRNIIKNKQVTIFNILGLSFSMSVCLLIIVIIQDQYSYDNMHSVRNNLYRIQTIDHNSKYSFNKYASTTYPLADELARNYPFVERIAVLNNNFGGEARYEDVIIDISGFYTDSRFFDVFDFNLVRGKKEEVLEQPFSIVMRDDIAKKYGGTFDDTAEGQVILANALDDILTTQITRSSLKGDVKGATGSMLQKARQSTLSHVEDATTAAKNAMSNINDEQALAALEDIIRSVNP